MPPRKSTSSTATKSPARSPSTSSTASTPSSTTVTKPRARSRSTSVKKAATKLSDHTYLTYAAYALGLIYVAFGLNAIVRPKPALTFFEVDYPILPTQQKAIDVLSAVYGARDVFVGAVVLLLLRQQANRKTLAGVVIGAGTLGVFDGVVCIVKVGKGQWNHLSWGPVVIAAGALLLGVADK